MSIETMIKRIQNIMRQDAGVDGDAQRISQLVWMLFLKIYDSKEGDWELDEINEFESIIPEYLKWSNWAIDNGDGVALTGEELIKFVNEELFPFLKSIEISKDTDPRIKIIAGIFEDSYNYMKDGILLRKVINIVNEVDFDSIEERHSFNDVYELILKDLQSAGNSGEFYTPRALTNFVVKCLNPTHEDSIGDFACGTGGFLISALNHIKKNEPNVWNNPEQLEILKSNIHGIEKKPMPRLLCMTNMILHDIDTPDIKNDNSLQVNLDEFTDKDKVDVIVMNPPYGGKEDASIQNNFPPKFRTAETADLFMVLMMNKLKENGRCGVVLPDSFIFGTDTAKRNIKEELFNKFNLHTIIRLPEGVFAPYTNISSNVVFFDNKEPSNELWIYDFKAPTTNGKYTKSKQLKETDLDIILDWWNNREENEFAHKISIEKIKENNYNLNFKNELAIKEEELEEPSVIIERISNNMDSVKGKLETLKGLLYL